MVTAAVIVAAGRGERAGHAPDLPPKQYRTVGGVPIVARSVGLFTDHPQVDAVQVVIAAGHDGLYRQCVPGHSKLLPAVAGGNERQESVLAGLEALAPRAPDRVLVHDAARPFATADLIARVVDGLADADAVLPVLPVVNTLKQVDDDGVVTATVPRERLVASETPQGFAFGPILAAYRRAATAGEAHTDDASVASAAGIAVRAVAGAPGNTKLTTAQDIVAADAMLKRDESDRLADVRVGSGYDVHAFGPGSQVMLGGIAIAHEAGLVGHSDADVVLHALTDAVLGALGEGDIGAHFLPGDAAWKGASSDRFLAFAAQRVAERGGIIAHLDVTLVGEGPKFAPHRDRVRERIAAICGIAVDRVGAKATTSEGLGFIGRKEGLAAFATATVRLPAGGSDG